MSSLPEWPTVYLNWPEPRGRTPTVPSRGKQLIWIRGRPLDSEVGMGLANFVGTDFLFSTWSRPENLFPDIPRSEFFFHPQQHFEKQEKKRGGGVCCSRRDSGQDFPCDFLFTFLQTSAMCIVHIVHMLTERLHVFKFIWLSIYTCQNF